MDGAEIAARLTKRPPLRSWSKTAFLLPLLAVAMVGDHDRTHEIILSGASAYPTLPLRSGLAPNEHLTAQVESASLHQIVAMYGELTGRTPGPAGWKENLNDLSGGHLAQWHVVTLPSRPSLLSFHNDGRWRADELKETLETILRTNGLTIIAEGDRHFRLQSALVSGQKVAY